MSCFGSLLECRHGRGAFTSALRVRIVSPPIAAILAVVIGLSGGSLRAENASEAVSLEQGEVVVDIKPPRATSGTARSANKKPRADAALRPKRRPEPVPNRETVEAADTETPAPKVAKPQIAGNKISVGFSAGGSDKEYALRFNWPVPVAAAVYRRGGYIWIIFDREETLDLSSARADGGKTMATLEQIPLALGTAARFRVEPGLYPWVQRNGNVWMVELRRRYLVPSHEISVSAQPRALVEPRVLLPVKGASNPLVMESSELSDTVFVIPVRGSGAGVGSDRIYPEFRLITTAQGIVVRSGADGLNVRRIREGIEITSLDGLILSGRATDRKDVRWPGDDTAAPRIIDIATWRRYGKDFARTKNRLQAEVAAASKSERGRTRLRLAQYYFAHGFYAEALGTLKLARKQDSIANEPAFRLFMGAAALLLKDLKLAGESLMDPSLNGQTEAMLWRATLRAEQLNWAAVRALMASARGLLAFYDEPFRSDFALIAARAQLEGSDYAAAVSYLDQLKLGKPTARQRAEGEYLLGMVLRARGEYRAALAQWGKLVDTRHTPTRVKARLARAELLFEQGEMSRAEIISELEDLRFAWRGDDIEFKILRLLAKYYIDEKRYRLALSNLRRAVDLYPDHPAVVVLERQGREVFLDLFLRDGANDLSPIAALAIYDEFKEFTPNDSRGDKMITALARRLIEADLLESAATLYRHQIKRRLKGTERSWAGTRLAAVLLLDRKPTEAIAVLKRTKLRVMSEDLQMERNRLHARALSDLGKQDQALDVIGSDPGPETDLVRAAIHWRMKNWPGASKSLGRLANQISVSDGELSDQDSKLILSWATALALSGDRNGLVGLRRRFDHFMEQGRYRDAYRVIANDNDAEITDYPSLVAKVREVAHYEGFMTDYRESLKGVPQSASKE